MPCLVIWQYCAHAVVDKTETECLIRLFNGLLGEQAERRAAHGLDRVRFRNILHNTFGMTDDMMMDSGTFPIWPRTIIKLV